MRAGEAVATFEVRQRTASSAGREIAGIDSVLDRLRQRDHGDEVLLFHFVTEDRFYTVFVDEDVPELIGCLSGRRGVPEP